MIIRSEYYDVTGSVIAPRAEGAAVAILTEKPERPYREVGVVRVLARLGTPKERMNEEMRRRAQEAGADAVIEVQYVEDTSDKVVFCGRVLSSKKNLGAIGKVIVFTDEP